MNIYKLYFTSPLHISDAREDYGSSLRQIHSDTMYAAIMHAWAILGKEEWITDKIDFTISSLFPFTYVKDEPVYFFPKPYVLPKLKNKYGSYTDIKKLKKITYLDKEYFEQLLYGNYDANTDDVRGEYLTRYNVDEHFISSQIVPRIRWHRKENEDAEPFYMEKLFFKSNSGLWFIFQGNAEEKIKIELALNLLQESGLGTDRNIGNGCFKYEKDELNLNIPLKTNYCINLSLYIPSDVFNFRNMLMDNQNKPLNNIGYHFIKRGGWIGEPFNTYRKKNIYMFSEGSVFRKDCSAIFSDGSIHDLKPENTPKKIEFPIYRVGKALFLPVAF